MHITPDSESLREFNTCHAPDSGKFCSAPDAGRGGGGSSRTTPPASWKQPSSNPVARRMGMTEEAETLDWLSRNGVPERDGMFTMYHATPVSSAFAELRPGSYLAQDAATAVQQGSRDRGLKAGAMKVFEVRFHPWEVVPSSVWAVTRVTLPLDAPRSGSTAMLDDYEAATQPHPFNNRGRLTSDMVLTELYTRGPNVRISAIASLGERGKGAGSRALQQITALADRHGVTLELGAKPFRVGGSGKRLTAAQLKRWYARHGFVAARHDAPGEMVRAPKRL